MYAECTPGTSLHKNWSLRYGLDVVVLHEHTIGCDNWGSGIEELRLELFVLNLCHSCASKRVLKNCVGVDCAQNYSQEDVDASIAYLQVGHLPQSPSSGSTNVPIRMVLL